MKSLNSVSTAMAAGAANEIFKNQNPSINFNEKNFSILIE